MICKMGKNKRRSAFKIFVDEQKDKVPKWRKKPMEEVVLLCELLWEDLSSEKKEEYKKKMRQEKSLRVERERLRVERELESIGVQSTEQERKEVRKEWRFDEDGNKLADDAMGDRYTGVYILQKGFFSNSSGIFGGATVHALIIGGAL